MLGEADETALPTERLVTYPLPGLYSIVVAARGSKARCKIIYNGKLAVEPITTPIVTCPEDKRFGNSDLAGARVAAASGEKARLGQKQLSQESSCRSARHILSFVSVFDHV